jgi:aminoglycoside/choline kinase family phosphotransferase
MNDASDERLAILRRWVFDELGFAGSRLEPASADASFRRYFRVTRGTDSLIVMDAPPDKEDLGPYLRVAEMLASIGVNVPIVLARNLPQGLLLLTDLGSRQYLEELALERNVDRLYADALAALAKIQIAGRALARSLPPYDAPLLEREMGLMPEWFLRRHLDIEVDAAARSLLERLFETLVQAALAQPATFVHRDYHSRNLMVLTDDNPGILDFQDAVLGPITYDLVSLLKDCYIAWPRPRVCAWALGFRRQLQSGGFSIDADEGEFLRWFDLAGLQRHIKVLGIFSRLYYRDGKAQYLKDLPRVLQYTRDTAALYPETAEFAGFIADRIEPAFERAQRRVLG